MFDAFLAHMFHILSILFPAGLSEASIGRGVLYVVGLCFSVIVGWFALIGCIAIFGLLVKVYNVAVHRPITYVMLNRRHRRMIAHRTRDAIRATDIEMVGILRYDLNGPYLEIETAAGPAKVRVSPQDVFPIMVNTTLPPTNGKESMMPRSVRSATPHPKCMVTFTVGDNVVGCGFRTLAFGSDVIIAPMHVLSALRKSGSPFDMSANGKVVTCDDELQNHIKVTFQSKAADLVGIEFPQRVIGNLGLTRGKVVRTALNQAVRTYGVIAAEQVMYTGTITKVASALRFHHNASTMPGFSGSPITDVNGAIMGIHLEGYDAYNVALSLDFLLNGRVESDFRLDAFANRVDEDEYDEVDSDKKFDLRFMHQEGDQYMEREIVGYSRNWTVRNVDPTGYRGENLSTLNRWSEDDDEGMEKYFAKSPFQESAQDFQSPLKTKGSDSANTISQEEQKWQQDLASVSERLEAIQSQMVLLQAQNERLTNELARTSRNSTNTIGQAETQKVSEKASESMREDTKKVPSTPEAPILPKLSKEQQKLREVAQGLFRLGLQGQLDQIPVWKESSEDDRQMVIRWFDTDTQRTAFAKKKAKFEKKSAKA